MGVEAKMPKMGFRVEAVLKFAETTYYQNCARKLEALWTDFVTPHLHILLYLLVSFLMTQTSYFVQGSEDEMQDHRRWNYISIGLSSSSSHICTLCVANSPWLNQVVMMLQDSAHQKHQERMTSQMTTGKYAKHSENHQKQNPMSRNSVEFGSS